jgi:hypothetical protein
MDPHDELVAGAAAQCLAVPGEVYAIYLPEGGRATLDLAGSDEPFEVRWYNPREGGELRTGGVDTITGPGKQQLGNPPAQDSGDWAILVRKGGG